MTFYSIIGFLACTLMAFPTLAGEIEVRLPTGSVIATAKAAARDTKLETGGEIRPALVTFRDLLPTTPYDIRIALTTGTVLQGVDFGWYADEPAKPDAGELTDDDRKEITSIVKDVPSFYNKSELLILKGSHDRAVGLFQLIRDSDFHSNKGDEVIWRIELFYFKFQAGGWEKVQQANKVLRRERFKSRAEFEKAISPIKWIPQLGGLRLAKDELKRVVELQK